MSIGKLVEKVLSFGVIIYASRYLGSEGIGQFFYYFSVVSLFIPLMDLGFEKLFLQRWPDLSGDERKSMLSRLTLLKLCSGTLALIFVVCVDKISRGTESNIYAIFASFLAIYFEQFGLLFRSPDRALYRVRLEVAVPVISRTITFALLWYYIGSIEHGYQICYLYLVSNIIGFFISIKGLNGVHPNHFSGMEIRKLKSLVFAGIPFSLTSLFVMTSLYVDSVILGHFSIEAVGDYNAAYRILLVFGLLSGGVCHAFFPRIIKWYSEGKIEFLSNILKVLVQGFLLIFGSLALGCFFFGKELILLLYGPSFEEAGTVFMFLSPLVILLSFTNLLGHTLEAFQQQKKTMLVCMVASVFNLLSNLVIIPVYGMYGAATTTMLTEGLSLSIYIWLICKFIPSPFVIPSLFRAGSFLMITGYIFYWTSSFGFWIAISTSIVAVLLLFYPLRNFWLYHYKGLMLEGEVD